MAPLAQVVGAYYHNLKERQIPDQVASDLTRDFQWYYLSDDSERPE